MSKQNGFTLIEMLFVLFILTIFLSLTVPITLKGLGQHQTNHFFKVLDSDILMIQSETFGITKNVQIVFEEEHYLIMQDKRTLERRPYPRHLNYVLRSNNKIHFNNAGTVINPTTYRFKDGTTTYLLTFTLGKGRHYIEEQ